MYGINRQGEVHVRIGDVRHIGGDSILNRVSKRGTGFLEQGLQRGEGVLAGLAEGAGGSSTVSERLVEGGAAVTSGGGWNFANKEGHKSELERLSTEGRLKNTHHKHTKHARC